MQTILIPGATGMLGQRIAYHLLKQHDVRVRLLIRRGTMSDLKKAEALAPLLTMGAETIEGDLSDIASLKTATAGVDVIVSAVQGGRDIIVDGQRALLDAATANGVRRFLPSDFALDLFKAPEGEHLNFNMRREADEAIAASGLEHVNVLNGAFMDNFLHAEFGAVFDMERGIASYWGSGDELFDATSVEDTARYTARAATDRELPSGKFAIAAEQLSFSGIIDAVEEVSGRRFERRSLGSIADLGAQIADQRRTDPGSMEALGNTYILYMLDGRTALTDLRNDRYPDIVPETYVEHVRRTWEAGK